jgi:hypothetical protein
MINKLAARHRHACAVIALAMAAISGSYILWAILDTHGASSFWGAYVIVTATLSVWNLAVYIAKSKQQKERRNGVKNHGATSSR